MRFREVHTERPALTIDEQQRAALNEFITVEVEDAYAARNMQESLWRECLRLYEGVPKNPVRNTPIENAPNIEIPLGAVASDSIYAQAMDLIYTVAPTLTARATNDAYTEHAKAIQRFANWGAVNEWKLRPASEHAINDDVQLGTGIYYIPFIEQMKKTNVHRVKDRGPRVLAIPPEDFFVPGGAEADLQMAKWVAPRFWYSPGELAERAQAFDWDVSGFAPVGNVGWVRSQREALGRTSSSRKITELYEVFYISAYFDIDGDGLDEDLLIVWDRTSRQIAKIVWHPFDYRPYETMVYQLRSHLFYGMGVIEMLRSFQQGVTEFYNWWAVNAIIANARIWKSRRGEITPGTRFWPNKVIELSDPNALMPEQMGDTYQSMPQAIAVTISLAERRAGINDMAMARPSQVLGSRTPGITALSMLQQVNRRFTPAFDNIRNATAGAVRQCCWRYQERLLAGDTDAEKNILRVLGEKDGKLAVEVLRKDDFNEGIAIELTASSASINRDADRQNAVMLVNLLGAYYEKVIQLSMIAANPQVPPEVKETAKKVAKAAGEAIDRTIRTFDQIRDPRSFIVTIDGQIDQSLAGQTTQDGLAGLGDIMQRIAQANGSAPTVPTGAA